jgi:hypothetical protein
MVKSDIRRRRERFPSAARARPRQQVRALLDPRSAASFPPLSPVFQRRAARSRDREKAPLPAPSVVEENGARLNRDRLANAYLLARSLAARPEPQPQSQSQIQRRAGAVQEAVIQVLAMAERPLQAREIHSAAQKLSGTPLSWNTVKDCLHKNARRAGSPIERVGYGRYRHS